MRLQWERTGRKGEGLGSSTCSTCSFQLQPKLGWWNYPAITLQDNCLSDLHTPLSLALAEC